MPPFFRFGLVLALSQALVTLIFFALGHHATAQAATAVALPENLVGFGLMMGAITWAHRSERLAWAKRGETRGFGAAARFTLGMALVASVVLGLFQVAYLAAINPALGESQRAVIEAGAAESLAKLSAEDLEQARRAIAFHTSPTARGIVHGLNLLVFGALMGLAFAVIFRAAARREAQAK
jgi:hypothetical protein